MLSAVILRNEYVTDCIPDFFCIEFLQTLFLRVVGSGAARLVQILILLQNSVLFVISGIMLCSSMREEVPDEIW